jgi:hypothetical protein
MNALRRAIQAITLLPLLVCIVAGYLGLRAVVWRYDVQVATQIQSGIVLSLVAGGLLALSYIIMGNGFWRILDFDWLSIQFGGVVGALLYGIYNAITPLTAASRLEPPLWRALQGGMDGLLIGMGIGLLVLIVGGRRLYFDRAGIIRYLILFIGVVLIAWVVIWVEDMIHIPDVVGLTLAIPLLVLLKLIVRRFGGGGNYGYDEG